MNTTELHLVIDTNIIVAIIGKHSPFRWIFDKILKGDFILCVSNEIVYEYIEIMEQKNGKAVASNFNDFLNFHPHVKNFEVFYKFNLISQDPSDNKFVDCKIVSNSICIISNDKHFQILKEIKFPKVAILTLQEFTQLFKDN